MRILSVIIENVHLPSSGLYSLLRDFPFIRHVSLPTLCAYKLIDFRVMLLLAGSMGEIDDINLHEKSWLAGHAIPLSVKTSIKMRARLTAPY